MTINVVKVIDYKINTVHVFDMVGVSVDNTVLYLAGILSLSMMYHSYVYVCVWGGTYLCVCMYVFRMDDVVYIIQCRRLTFQFHCDLSLTVGRFHSVCYPTKAFFRL